MLFPTKIRGIPCQVNVIEAKHEVPGTLHHPPEPRVFEYDVYNLKGQKIDWLKNLVTERIENELFEQFQEYCDQYLEDVG